MEQVTKIKLIIELREDGKVYLTGPIESKDLCNALLDEAKEVVKNYKKITIAVPTKQEIKKLSESSSI